MIKDLRERTGLNSGLYKCYLVDESKRITSPYLNVHIPKLMNRITPGIESGTITLDKTNMLNDNTDLITEVTLATCIRAKCIHGYRFKHEGWIPEFKTETATATEISASSTEGVTEAAPHVPSGPHHIKAALKLFTNTIKSIVFTNSTEVDYQELNRIYIKKGHLCYGFFVDGGDSDEFVITAIDNVIPYYDEDTDNGANNAMPTTG